MSKNKRSHSTKKGQSNLAQSHAKKVALKPLKKNVGQVTLAAVLVVSWLVVLAYIAYR